MNVMAISYWSMGESLTQSAGLPYMDMILKHLPANSFVYYLTLEKPEYAYSPEEKKSLKAQLTKRRIIWLDYDYHPFGKRMMWQWMKILPSLHRLCRRDAVKLLISFGPVAGSSVYLLHKTTGIPFVVDGYEPHAQSMVENGTWAPESLSFKLLSRFEKWQTRSTFAVLATSNRMDEYAKETYGCSPKRFYVKRAVVDLDRFLLDEKPKELVDRYGLADKTTLVYAGKFGGIYLEHEVFTFIKHCAEHWGDQFKVLLMTDTPRAQVEKYCSETGVDPNIVISFHARHEEVPDHLLLGDFAINPVKPVPSKRYCTSVKDGEYWACGLPVVIPHDIADDSDIIEERGIGAVLKGFAEADYKEAIQKMDAILQSEDLPAIKKRIRQTAIEYRSFEIADEVYREILADLDWK